MSKGQEVAQVSAKGSLHYMGGMIVSSLILSVASILIARLLGSNLYGLYTIALTIPSFIGIFRDWGINSAVTRYSAKFQAENMANAIKNIVIVGLIFEISAGLILSIFSVIFSDFFVSILFNRPQLVGVVQIASFSILAGGLGTFATSAFTGIGRMGPNNIMLIIQAITRTLLVFLFIFLGLGATGAVLGYTIGFLSGGIIGIFLVWVAIKEFKKISFSERNINSWLGEMLQYGVPLSISGMITSLLPQFFALLLPIYYTTDNSPIGNFGVASNFIILIGFFSTPILTMLFPAFSKINAETDRELLKNIFRLSVKYASLIVVPAVALVMCLARPAVSTLFGSTYTSASLYLGLLAIPYLYTACGNLSVANVINGQGHTRLTLKLGVLTAIIAIPMGYILILMFGVLGLIITSIVSVIPCLVISLYFIKKTYGVTVDWVSSGRILISSAFAAIGTFITISLLAFPSWVELLIGIIIYFVIILPCFVLTRAINRSDISNFRKMFDGLSVVGAFLNKLLSIIEKLMTISRIEVDNNI